MKHGENAEATAAFFAERDPKNRIGLGVFDPDEHVWLLIDLGNLPDVEVAK